MVVGKPEWKPLRNEGPTTWYFGHWLIWFLLISGNDGSGQFEARLADDLATAFTGKMRSMLALNILLELMSFQQGGGRWSQDDVCCIDGYQRNLRKLAGLGRHYFEVMNSDQQDALLERESQLFTKLVNLASGTRFKGMQTDYFQLAMYSEIYPQIIIGNVPYRVLGLLEACGKIEKPLPWDALHQLEEWRLAETSNERTFAALFQRMELLIPCFRSYLNRTFNISLGGASSVTVDTAAFVCYRAYEWHLDNLDYPDSPNDFYDRNHGAPMVTTTWRPSQAVGPILKQDWASTCHSILKVLRWNGASLSLALRACVDDEPANCAEAYSLRERVKGGMWCLALLLLEEGTNPNSLFAPDFRVYRTTTPRLLTTPFHVTDPAEEWQKKLFFAFLDAGFQGLSFGMRGDGPVPVILLVCGATQGDQKVRQEKLSRRLLDPPYFRWYLVNYIPDYHRDYLELLEAMLRRRPENMQLDAWRYVLDHVEREREEGTNLDLVRIVDEAEKRRQERPVEEPADNASEERDEMGYD
ncbi:hypothetical protein BJ508DRAFT_155243 [Ascobolus immersus RN42]|uniref:Uncharacterized protein n=1 Tax=Ascobolus immersus RN42 TaxID=1160509 RepID=A0A3N4I1I3_ASCIM|nr:hypothetical protein BJ508DRAFT_155243 [Ascobolus immersus RN42]